MLAIDTVKQHIKRSRLTFKNEKRRKIVVDRLAATLKDNLHLDYFDCFEAAWNLQAPWIRLMLINVLYRHQGDACSNITQRTQLLDLNQRQRELLEYEINNVIAAVMTLTSDYHFIEEFYSGWAEARREALGLPPKRIKQ